MPFYNAHAHVLETVQSVLAQTYPNFELIIVNDGSKPPSIEEVLSGIDMSRINIPKHEKNKGLAATRNTGFNSAKGDLILPLDADDLIIPDFLELTVKAMLENPDVSAVFTQVQMFGELDLLWVPEDSMLHLMCGMPIQSTVLFKKEVFEAVGGYNTVIRNAPDVEFWIRVMARGYKLLRLEKPLYLYRKHAGSLSDEGQFTEVVDLARANKELYLQNIDAVFKLEQEKFDKTVAQLNVLKDGYNQLYEGYLNLQLRYKDLESQFDRKKKSCPSLPPGYLKSADFDAAMNKTHQAAIEKPDFEGSGEKWLDQLDAIEREYFATKRTYRIIEAEFKKLEILYNELHLIFNQQVEKLKQLGVRFQLGKLLGIQSSAPAKKVF